VHDGVTLGETFMTKVEYEKARVKEQKINPVQVRISECFAKYGALQELDLLHPAVSSILTAVVHNKFWKPLAVSTALSDLTEAGGTDIGR